MLAQLKTRYLPDNIYEVSNHGKYVDGSPLISIVDVNSNMIQMKASVCMAPDHTPVFGHAYIKDYAENEGIMDQLIQAGAIGKPVSTIKAGHAEVHMCKILIGGAS